MSDPQAVGQPTPYNFQSLSVLQFLFKWRWHILGATLLAAIAAAVFSGPSFIKPKYASTVVFYAANNRSISTTLPGSEANAPEDPLAFGDEEQSEQLLQLLLSEELKDKIVTKFNLVRHYDIDTTSRKRLFLLDKAFAENVRFRRTEYTSVEIKVLDTDPILAAAIANDIGDLLDETKQGIQRAQALKVLAVVQAAYNGQRKTMQAMADSMQFLRKQGVFDYATQTELTTEELIKNRSMLASETARLKVYQAAGLPSTDTAIYRTKARIAGATNAISGLEDQMATLARYGGAYSMMSDQMEEESLKLVELGGRLERARIDANEVLPAKFIINKARVSDSKVYPVRWLIVAIAAAGAFVFSVVSLVIIENYASLAKRPSQQLRKTA